MFIDDNDHVSLTRIAAGSDRETCWKGAGCARVPTQLYGMDYLTLSGVLVVAIGAVRTVSEIRQSTHAISFLMLVAMLTWAAILHIPQTLPQLIALNILIWYLLTVCGNLFWGYPRLIGWVVTLNGAGTALSSLGWIAHYGFPTTTAEIFAHTPWSLQLCVSFAVADCMHLLNGHVWHPTHRSQSWTRLARTLAVVLALTGWGHPAPYPNLLAAMLVGQGVLALLCGVRCFDPCPSLRPHLHFLMFGCAVLWMAFHAAVLSELLRNHVIHYFSPISGMITVAMILNCQWFGDILERHARS